MVVKVVCLREALASRDTSLCQNPGLRLRGDEGEGSREREGGKDENKDDRSERGGGGVTGEKGGGKGRRRGEKREMENMYV